MEQAAGFSAYDRFLRGTKGMADQGRMLRDAPMREYTTLHIGGCADLLALPESEEELHSLLRLAAECRIPVTVIGNGSNLLVLDGGIRGLTIQIGRCMSRLELAGCVLTAQAGASLTMAAKNAAAGGLKGLAFAGGIPGTVGGGTVMNAGAYGGEMKDVVTRVSAVTMDGKPVVCTGAEMAFGYRTSRAQQEKWIITQVEMTLTPGDKAEILAEMNAFNARRREKQPLEWYSAGSTFKRPEGGYAGTLIDQCGLKGFAVGDAQVSEKHAGFLINRGHATAGQFLQLVSAVQQRVLAQKGVRLEMEVQVLGSASAPVRL